MYEQSKLAVHDYTVGVKYRRLWETILENKPPTTRQMALDRVLGLDASNPEQKPDEFAFIGNSLYYIHCENFYYNNRG